MKHISLLSLFFLLISCSKNPAENLEMHRLSTENPTDSGWHLAESTEGHFSVLLPMPFNDFTVFASDPKLGRVETYTVGFKTADGFKFSASEIPKGKGMKEPDFDEVVENLKDAGNEISDLTQSESEISFHMIGGSNEGIAKYVKTDFALFMLMIEFPTGQYERAAEFRDTFFNSLKIKGPNK